MEYAIFPLRHTWESQPMNGTTSHLGILAIDCGVLNPYNDTKLYAPFTGTIVYVDNVSKGHGIAFQSDEKVIFANGTIDYMTVWTGHSNSDIKVGQKFKQNEHYSDMGTAGGVATHTHLETIRGKFKMATSTTSQGSYKFENAIEPFNALFLTKDSIYKYSKYTWKKLPDIPPVVQPTVRNEQTVQIKVLVDSLRVRTDHSTNSQELGYTVKNGIYNDLEVYKDKYTWHRIAEGQWVADNGTWLELLPVKNYKELYEKELENNKVLQEQVNSLTLKLKDINKISTI